MKLSLTFMLLLVLVNVNSLPLAQLDDTVAVTFDGMIFSSIFNEVSNVISSLLNPLWDSVLGPIFNTFNFIRKGTEGVYKLINKYA